MENSYEKKMGVYLTVICFEIKILKWINYLTEWHIGKQTADVLGNGESSFRIPRGLIKEKSANLNQRWLIK